MSISIRNKLSVYESHIYGTYMAGDPASGNSKYLVFEKGKIFSYHQNHTVTEFSAEELSEKLYAADDNKEGKTYFIKGVEDGKAVVYMCDNSGVGVTIYEKIDDVSVFINVKH